MIPARLPSHAFAVATLALAFFTAASAASFSWQTGPYGPCSVSCGGGTQTRSVTCVDDFGAGVAEAFCAGIPKPPNSQSCNTQACTYSWQTGPYGACSEACGGGTRTRNVRCILDGPGTPVADSFCAGTPRPPTSEACNTQPCYSWSTGEYGACSNPCGLGTQTRSVVCIDHLGAPVADALCPPPRPQSEQTCTGQTCSPQVPSLRPLARVGFVALIVGIGGAALRRTGRRR